jgi:hypothetical protein
MARFVGGEVGAGGSAGSSAASKMGQRIVGGKIVQDAVGSRKSSLRKAADKIKGKFQKPDVFVERPMSTIKSSLSPERREMIARNAAERKSARAENRDAFIERLPSPRIANTIARRKADLAKAERNRKEQEQKKKWQQEDQLF